jgi:hypothetical protein
MRSAVEITAAKLGLRHRMGWHWGGRHTRKWHGLPQGIVGVGFGVKRSGGKFAAEDCIRVYVRSKRAQSQLTQRQLIPKKIDGYFTDVIPVRSVRAHAAAGESVGNSRGVSGTLGCIVKDDSAEYLLGSWHVLTNVYGQDGDSVYMPSLSADGSAPVVGKLIATPIFHLNTGSNAFDASVATRQPGVVATNVFPGLGNVVLPTMRAVQSASVVKQGVSTGITYGSVDGVSEDISIMYNGDASCCAVLAGQIAIVGDSGSFSDEGDSGALVCSRTLQPMGILVGGSQTSADSPVAHSFVSPIDPILSFYEVTIKA